MQRKQDVARGHEQPGSAWMQQNQALQQHGCAGKAEGPAFSHVAWQVATYCSYFAMCLCLQLYSAPHFAFKYMVQLLLLLNNELGPQSALPAWPCAHATSWPWSQRSCTSCRLLLASRGTKGGWGAWWSSPELGHGFNCCWKVLPSTLFNLWFYKCAVPNCMTCCWDRHKKVPVKSLNNKQNRRGPWTCCKQFLLVTYVHTHPPHTPGEWWLSDLFICNE